ncbi:MAG: hypothetical protein VX704_01315, partial [Verrucomicrobiota bacterium]|nr:hypothetical protein [Verrucomicrobiota bacterium]
MRVSNLFLIIALFSLISFGKAQDTKGSKLPLIFEEDFEKGHSRWEVTDAKSWSHRKEGSNQAFGINRRKSDYKPKVRSPYHIALIKGVEVADFELTFDVKSTKDTGGHRDCCVFFNWQDAEHFYYCHFGAN